MEATLNSRRVVSFLAIVGCLAVIGEGLTGIARSTTPTQAGGAAPDSCAGRIDAWSHPHLVPGYLAWESFFASVEQPDSTLLQTLSVDGTAKDRILSQATFARSRAKAARASASAAISTGKSVDGEIEGRAERGAAQAIVEARDELLRSLPDDVTERIVHASDDQARRQSFAIAAPRKLVQVDGQTKCRVTVKGREFPHLIPEADYWEFYFRVRQVAAAPFAEGDKFAAGHVLALQRSRELEMPAEYIQRILRFATDTMAHVDSLRGQGADDAQIAETILKARTTLLRTLPGPVWLLVNRDAARVRAGEEFTFPSTY